MKNGQTLVELLLAIGLASILLPALITGLVTSREGKSQQAQRVRAVSLLRETQEAVRSIRNRDWSNIAVNGTYHPVISGTMWASASASLTSNGFTQSYTVSDVNRDTNGNIVTAPSGALDPSTKKIDVEISWTQPYSSSVTSSIYLTRWRDNLPYTETTEDQFNAGTHTCTTVRSSAPQPIPTPGDGEIILGSGGHSNWCEPSISQYTEELPKNGVGKAISAISGQAVAGTGENSSGVSFANIIISDTYPPEPNTEATFDGFKTNSVFTELDYAYLATDTNGKQGEIINLNSITNGKYAEAGYLDLESASVNGRSIFVLNDTAYLTGSNSKLYKFALTSDRLGRFTASSSVTLPGVGNKIIVKDNYAYIAVNNASTQMQIVDVSTMILKGSINLGNSRNGIDLAINDTATRAYLATAVNTNANQGEFFAIDISNINSLTNLGNFDTGAMDPKGTALVPGSMAVLVGHGGIEYQVVRLDNDNLQACGSGVDANIDINGVASVKEADNDAYSYIISDSDPEFRIIEGGPGGGYSNQGIFESQTFNPGYSTADNRFEASFSQPSDSTIQFQVALANQVAGSCPGTYTFVGQDGTSSTWFPLTPTPGLTSYSNPFPFGTYGLNYSNTGQCFRYKVNMTTTDTSQTPILYDFTINYSP